MTELKFRHLNPHEHIKAFTLFSQIFAEKTTPQSKQAEIAPLAPNRSVGAFEGEWVVGNVGVYSLNTSIPGGFIDTLGITHVFVDATHRRQGVGKQLMNQVLQEAHEPIAALWASRPGFYQTIGFAPATLFSMVEIDTSLGTHLKDTAPKPERVTRPSVDQAAKILPEIYEQARRRRSGMTSRDPDWWQRRFIGDIEWRRDGTNELLTVIAWRDNKPMAYAIYGLKSGHSKLGPANELTAFEVVGATGWDELSLMTWLANHDLVVKMSAGPRPIDDGLIHTMRSPRHLEATITDGLHLRILDLEKALSARMYFDDLDITLGISDDILMKNSGMWRLRTSRDGGQVERIDSPLEPDVILDISALSSVYLGNGNFQQLESAGLVYVNNPAVLIQINNAFTTPRAPWCPEIW